MKFPFFQVPDPHGNIGFSQNETAFPSGKYCLERTSVSGLTGDSMASALLGLVDSGAISTTNFVSSQKVAFAGYAQDVLEGKLRRLTLNLGVRYELWSPIGEQWGRQANYDLQNNTLYIPQGGNCNDSAAAELRRPVPDRDRGPLPRFELSDPVGQAGLRTARRHRVSGEATRP